MCEVVVASSFIRPNPLLGAFSDFTGSFERNSNHSSGFMTMITTLSNLTHLSIVNFFMCKAGHSRSPSSVRAVARYGDAEVMDETRQ